MCYRSQAAHSGHNMGFRPHHPYQQYFGKFRRPEFNQGSAFQAPVNVIQKDDLYELELYMPGKSREDFTIGLSGLELTIAFKGEEQKTSTPKWTRREFYAGSFERSFQLDDTIDTDLITARYDNGILIVLLPVKLESRRKTQQVNIL